MEQTKPRAKAYIYTRVSTAMQVDGFSLDAQREEIKRFAELKRIDIVGEYCDEGKSGKNTKNRTEFNRMLTDIKRKKDDVRYVLVFKLSRFARNAADTLENLRAMQNCDVDLLCTEDGLDSSSTSGKLMISIMSAFAEMELENIHTQTMAGRRQKAKEGKWNGGFAPYGYKLVDGLLTIVEDEAKTVKYIFELFTSTPLGANGVAKRLNAEGIIKNERPNGKHTVFTGDFIKKTIDNPVYMGKIAYGRRKTEKVRGEDGRTHIVKETDESNIIISEGVHEAIVSEEVWNDAHDKRIRTGVKKEKLEKEHEYILSGLLRCPACGKPMYGIPSRKKRKDGTPYPVSYAYKCRQSKNLTGIDCTFNKQFNCREIDAEVSTAISMCFLTPDIVERIRAEMNREYDVSALEEKLENVKKNQKVLLARKKKLEQARDALDPLDRNFDMKFDSFTDSLDKVFDELREVERVIESIENKIRTATNSKKTKEDAIQLLLEFGQMYPTLPEAEQKKIANVLIESIDIFPTKRAYGYLKTIHFSFPVLSGDEIKQTMSIWDTHPDILDEEGNFNGYNPEDDLPPVEMETGTIVVHPEGDSFPPKRITDEIGKLHRSVGQILLAEIGMEMQTQQLTQRQIRTLKHRRTVDVGGVIGGGNFLNSRFADRSGNYKRNGVNHAANAAGGTRERNGLIRGSVHRNFIVCTIIGVLCQSIGRTVDRNFRGGLFIFCHIEDHRRHILRDSERERTCFFARTNFYASIALCITGPRIHIYAATD